MPQNDNRNIIMEIQDDLSLTFFELPDGAKAVKIIKVEDVKKRAVNTWRWVPLLVSVLLWNVMSFHASYYWTSQHTQFISTRSDELIVRMQKDKLYFDVFREPILQS